MRSKAFLLIVVAAFAIAAGCGETKPKPKEWKEFVSAEHNFSALFPASPVAAPKQKSAVAGGEMSSHMFYHAEEKFKYEVVCSELPAAYKNYPADKLLDSLLDSTLKTLGASSVVKKNAAINGFSGREFSFDLPGGMAGRGKIAADGNKVYIAIMKMSAENRSSDETVKFLGSFAIGGKKGRN